VRALEISDTATRQGFKPNWLRTPTSTMIEASRREAAEAAGEDEA
jgi:hypothetical protein